MVYNANIKRWLSHLISRRNAAINVHVDMGGNMYQVYGAIEGDVYMVFLGNICKRDFEEMRDWVECNFPTASFHDVWNYPVVTENDVTVMAGFCIKYTDNTFPTMFALRWS